MTWISSVMSEFKGTLRGRKSNIVVVLFISPTWWCRCYLSLLNDDDNRLESSGDVDVFGGRGDWHGVGYVANMQWPSKNGNGGDIVSLYLSMERRDTPITGGNTEAKCWCNMLYYKYRAVWRRLIRYNDSTWHWEKIRMPIKMAFTYWI